ncbi:MAG: efflux RND transporter periplasmic adaptor subunit [Planctomycetota bacterium]
MTFPHPKLAGASAPLVLLALLALATGCKQDGPTQDPDGGKAEATKARPKLVGVEVLAPRTVEERIPCTSHITAFHELPILSEVAGQVVDVEIEDGALVEQDQVLFRIDDDESRLALDTAKNEEKAAETQVEENDLAFLEAKKRVATAEIERLDAESQFERARKGRDEGLTSTKDFDLAKLSLDKAESELELARFAERKAELGKIKAGNDLESKVIARKLRELDLAKHVVRAPFAGVVPRRAVKGGEWITSSTELCRLVDHRHLVLELPRPQRQLGRIEVGQRVDVEVDSHPDRRFVARVGFVSPVVDQATGTFLVRARVEDPDGALRSGMFCRAEIVTKTSRDALMVPKLALLYEGQLPYAFVVRDGKAVQVPVDVGIEVKDAVEAVNRAADGEARGFRVGDLVVVKGKEKLEDGEVVKVDAPAGAAPTEAAAQRREGEAAGDGEERPRRGPGAGSGGPRRRTAPNGG